MKPEKLNKPKRPNRLNKPDRLDVKMGENIFYGLIIFGLCFGQSIWRKDNLCISLPMRISITPYKENGIPIKNHSFSAPNILSQSNKIQYFLSAPAFGAFIGFNL